MSSWYLLIMAWLLFGGFACDSDGAKRAEDDAHREHAVRRDAGTDASAPEVAPDASGGANADGSMDAEAPPAAKGTYVLSVIVLA